MSYYYDKYEFTGQDSAGFRGGEVPSVGGPKMRVTATEIAYRLVWVSVWEPYMQLLHCVPDLHCFF